MLTTILQMEEQGMSSEQAKTEAFLCDQRRKIGGRTVGKATGFMDYDRQDKPAEDPKERIKHFKGVSYTSVKKKNRNCREPDVWHAAYRSASPVRC